MSDRDLEGIRASINGLPENVVRDALALVLTDVGNERGQRQTVDMQSLERERIKDVFELFSYIKRTYSFPELDRFLVEGGKLMFKDGDRRIIFAEKVSAMPYSLSPSSHNEKNPITNKRAGGQNDMSGTTEKNDGPERFRRLELDD